MDNPENLFRIISPEAESKDRSKLTIYKANKALKINISAKDAVALKASVNIITKALTIYESMENIKNA